MTFTDAMWLLIDGGVVTDIGQISLKTKRFINRAVKLGLVIADTNYDFPTPKRCWHCDPAALRPSLRAFLKREAEAGRTPLE